MKKILQKFFKEEDANVTIQAVIFMAAGVSVVAVVMYGQLATDENGEVVVVEDGLVTQYGTVTKNNTELVNNSVDSESERCWDWWNNGNENATRLNADKERNCK